MKGRVYEMNNDYILDVLEDAANETMNKIFARTDEELQHELMKLLAILNEIEKINIKKNA